MKISHPDAAYWITSFGLKPHPEGGWYREIYRSEETIPKDSLPGRFGGERPFATTIYFLLSAGEFSAFHRIKSDESWHFYTGCCLNIYTISKTGTIKIMKLGNDPQKGQVFHAVVPHGQWFASRITELTGYALVGCTVAPGFDFADFEMAERKSLVSEYPQHAELIEQLTREKSGRL